MSKLRLWGHPKSINVQKVLWALDELDLEFEGIDAGVKFGRVKDADFLTLNPNGLVPTLEDDNAAPTRLHQGLQARLHRAARGGTR